MPVSIEETARLYGLQFGGITVPGANLLEDLEWANMLHMADSSLPAVAMIDTYGWQPKEYKFYHGTSWVAAQQIEQEGFIESASGCLGAGVYLAHHAKARHFAEDAARHGGTVGGLVEVLVQINKPKFVPSDNQTWRSEGFDACRAARTSLSPHMEWCIASPSHVRVLRIKTVERPAAAAAASGSESAEPATSASSCAP
jgi:hypothetical protein